MSHRLSLLMLLIFAVPAMQAAAPAEKIQPDDEKLLKAGKLAAEGPALLDYFRKRTIAVKEREQIDTHIRLLGDDSFKVREKASDDLVTVGASALPQLRRALQNPDEEVRERAREAIAAVESKANPALTLAAVRVLRVRAPAEAVKVLFEYVPDAENDAVFEEVLTTLAILGVKENKIDPLLVEAIKDKLPARRAAGALVVGRSGNAEQRRGVQALLKDTDVRVRFRAAQGLLAARERSAIPVFISLLTDAPPEVAARAEEMLSCATGVQSPPNPNGEIAQQYCNMRPWWEQWWKKNPKFDLARADVDLPPFNPTLRARETARQFIAALVASDKEKVGKCIDVPFQMLGRESFTQRDKAETSLAQIVQHLFVQGLPLNPVVHGTTTFEEYSKKSPPPIQQQLAKLPKKDVRVVLIRWPNFGGGMSFGESAVFVRVSDEQPKVIGVNLGFDPGPRSW